MTMDHNTATLIQHAQMIGNLFEEASRRKDISYQKQSQFSKFFEATIHNLARKSLKRYHTKLLAPPNPRAQLVPIVVKLPEISIHRTDSIVGNPVLGKTPAPKKQKRRAIPFKQSRTTHIKNK